MSHAADRVLITGASGFVGRAVVPALLGSGRTLTLAGRRPAPGGVATGPVRDCPVGPLGPDTVWCDALRDVGAVVHLAAHVHVRPEKARAEEQLFDAVNHRATVRLFEEAARSGVGLFVFVSSVTVLGQGSPADGFDERADPRPDTPYSRSKLAAEAALRERASQPGAPRLVILRPPLVAGSGVRGNLGALARLAASPWPLPFGGIANRRTILSLPNLCDALLAVLMSPVPGTFGLGDAEPLSTSDIVASLRQGAGGRAPLFPLPPRLQGLLRRRTGVGRRLFGDLVLRSDAFRAAYGWTDVVDTRDTLRSIGAAAARAEA